MLSTSYVFKKFKEVSFHFSVDLQACIGDLFELSARWLSGRENDGKFNLCCGEETVELVPKNNKSSKNWPLSGGQLLYTKISARLYIPLNPEFAMEHANKDGNLTPIEVSMF